MNNYFFEFVCIMLGVPFYDPAFITVRGQRKWSLALGQGLTNFEGSREQKMAYSDAQCHKNVILTQKKSKKRANKSEGYVTGKGVSHLLQGVAF